MRFSEFINRFDTNGSLFVSERGGGPLSVKKEQKKKKKKDWKYSSSWVVFQFVFVF